MRKENTTRRDLLKMAGFGTAAALAATTDTDSDESQDDRFVDKDFFIRPEELTLKFLHGEGKRRLSFHRFEGTPQAWREACRAKLAELLGFVEPSPCPARLVRSTQHEGVHVEAWVMQVDERLSIPAYLLSLKAVTRTQKAVMAVHGHGEAESCVGVRDDYHHAFALRLAQAGHVVLCPALRGFGALGDMAFGDESHCLDYWKSRRGRQFTLISDAFLYGQTVIGQTVADLLRWERWLSESYGVQTIDVVGISYGGDLAVTYPVFSNIVGKIYASGTLGSFAG
ncbi:MAG: dienelactone hydrolase family protein, partial [Planctomycetota bacterium]